MIRIKKFIYFEGSGYTDFCEKQFLRKTASKNLVLIISGKIPYQSSKFYVVLGLTKMKIMSPKEKPI